MASLVHHEKICGAFAQIHETEKNGVLDFPDAFGHDGLGKIQKSGLVGASGCDLGHDLVDVVDAGKMRSGEVARLGEVLKEFVTLVHIFFFFFCSCCCFTGKEYIYSKIKREKAREYKTKQKRKKI